MTKDNIIRMAREAGVVIDGNNSGEDSLLYFAALVAAAERESNSELLEAMEQEPDRRLLQAAGTHPAPCARHCEAKAFEIEIRGLKSALKQAQPVQPEPLEYWSAVEGWVKIDEVREHFDAVNCGTIYKHGGEGRVPLYTAPPQQQAEPPPEWLLIKNILDEYGLQAIDFVAEFKAAQQVATIWKQPKQQAPFSPEVINTTQTAWKMGYEAAKAEQQQAEQQQAEPVAWDKPSDNFNAWWDGDRRRDNANPFTTDSFAYWAFEGWQAALAQRPWQGLEAEDLAQIESDEFWQVGNHMAIAMAVEDKLKERNT